MTQEQQGEQIHFFARGNTAEGLYSLVESVYQRLSAIYVLDGFPGGTAAVIGRLAADWNERGWNLQLIHDPLESDLLEGIIVKDLSIGVINAEAWPESLTELPGTEVHKFDLQAALNSEKLTENSVKINTLLENAAASYEQAYTQFAQTLRIHDDWEKYYIEGLDRDRMNRLAVEWSNTYLDAVREGKQAGVTRRFLGAATWRGAVDFVMNLTDSIHTRVFVKGRPGSGKSTLFKKIAASAIEKGIDTEIYHCGFDPNSLDMLIFPELSLAIFDSTAPHEHFPVREGDSILDVYDLAIAEGTDEKYADELRQVKERYTASMKQAIGHLGEVKEVVDQLVAIYREATDDAALSILEESLLMEISALT